MDYFISNKVQPIVESYVTAYNNGDIDLAKKLFETMYEDLRLVIRGVIFTQNYHRWGEDVDVLVNVAFEALLGKSGLAKFDPLYTGFKGKKENLLFSFISLIAKRSVYFHLCKKKKESCEISYNSENGIEPGAYDTPSSTLLDDSDVIIRRRFEGTRFYPCYDYLIKYIKINGVLNTFQFRKMVMANMNQEYIIPGVNGKTTITQLRAKTIIRETLKLYKIYLREYLEDINEVSYYKKF